MLEHYLAKGCDNLAVLFDRDALHNHGLSVDRMRLVYLRYPRFGHDMHPGILDNRGYMSADLEGRLNPQKLSIWIVEINDVAIGIGNNDTVVNIVHYQFQEPDSLQRGALVLS